MKDLKQLIDEADPELLHRLAAELDCRIAHAGLEGAEGFVEGLHIWADAGLR
jgi:hypothetical protein